jgi:uncharacterized membrane-anchored protein
MTNPDLLPTSLPSGHFPPEHPLRGQLTNELHARQPPALTGSTRATYLALLVEPSDRERELAHIARLCESHGVAAPAPGCTWFTAELGSLTLQWEAHVEFSGLTFYAPSVRASEPFSMPATDLLPPGWLAGMPGQTLVAAHAKYVHEPTLPADQGFLDRHFLGNFVLGSEIGDGAALAFTDFRLHADGFGRFVLLDRHLTPRQAGRMIKRLFEIEAYRMLALLALPVARRKTPELDAIGATLARVTDEIAKGNQSDEVLLPELTDLAARVERELAQTQFRFDACKGYHEVVRCRIAELREHRLAGLQTIEEFMARRLTPAVARVTSLHQRLQGLSERVARASTLLSTRVDIAHSQQNQNLLASMNKRARQQLMLQQTVEGLSVAAITYYTIGLVGYAAKGAHAFGLAWSPDAVIAVSLPIVLVAVVLALRRAHRALHGASPHE